MSEENLRCPKCGQTEYFDITDCDGCFGEVREIYCPQCDTKFNPRTGETS